MIGAKKWVPFSSFRFPDREAAGWHHQNEIISCNLPTVAQSQYSSLTKWIQLQHQHFSLGLLYLIARYESSNTTIKNMPCLHQTQLSIMQFTVVESFLLSNADFPPVCPCSLCSRNWAQTWAGSTLLAALRLSFQKIFCMTLPINFLPSPGTKLIFITKRTN